jgi:putative DNA primase/helicase
MKKPFTTQRTAPPLQSEPAPASPSDFDRLALLTPFQYDRVRKAEAKRLNLRLRTLDDAVDDARTLLDDAEADNLGVRLLEPWPEPILNAPELFDQIHDCYPIYLYLPAGAAVILTLWPAHAHVLNAFTHTPRLHLTSAKPGCGKSTVFDVVAAFCPRVLHTNNLRPAVLYRGMHGGQLIVALLDELEYYVQRFPELNGLLNASNKRGTLIHRCEGNKVRAFKIFAATGLSGLGHLVPTVLDRSISLHLLEAPKGVLKARFIPEEAHAEKILGRKLARWAQDNYDAIAATAANPVMPDAAYNRLGDNWRPLFALAQVIGGHWPERLTAAFHALSSSPSDPQLLTLNSQLLGDIHHIFTRTSASRIFSADLVTALCALPDRPWSGNKNGHRPLTQATLARQLAPFKIFPLLLRIGDRRAKGYCATDFGHPAK